MISAGAVHLHRARVSRRLDDAGECQLTLFFAEGGSGKTSALHDYARERPAVVMTRVMPDATDVRSVARSLCEALAERIPGAHLSIAVAFERGGDVEADGLELAAWFIDHLRDLRVTIILDDAHVLSANAASLRFLIAVLDSAPPLVRFILSGESTTGFPVDTWLAYGRAAFPTAPHDLKLDVKEAIALAESIGASFPRETIAALVRVMNGWTAGIVAALRIGTFAADRFIAISRMENRSDAYEAVIDIVLADFTVAERELLARLAMLPDIDAALVRSYGGEIGESILARIVNIYPECVVAGSPRIFEGSFARSLRSLAHATVTPLEIGAAFEDADRVDEALRAYAEAGSDAHVGALLERSGIRLLDEGKLDLIAAALQPRERIAAAEPIVPTLRAMVEASRGRYDIAEAWYRLAIDRAYDDLELEMRIVNRFALDLIRRERYDVIELLEPYLEREGLEVETILQTRASLATAYVSAGRTDDALRLVATVERDIESIRSEVTRARALHQISFVYLNVKRYDEARSFALRAISTAESVGAFDIASRAATVLYVISYDLEDDVAHTLTILDRAAAFAAKSGNTAMRLFALIGAFDIEVDRGDTEAIERLAASIRAAEVTQFSAMTTAALLPAEAMQLAWRGEFAAAVRLLGHSAERQHDDDRRALRLAEVALYSAAQHDREAASTAMADAESILETNPVGDRRERRTRVFIALASLLLGDERTDERIEGLSELVPSHDRRTRALVNVLRVLRLAANDRSARGALRSSLAILRSEGFAGIARLIGALPSDLLLASKATT